MIRAKHTKTWFIISKFLPNFLTGFFFRNVRYIGEYEEKGLPILLISNHFSWFDGFIQIPLNFKVFKRRYHFMMLEKELRKNKFLTQVGASSIVKGKRKSLESLKYAVEILQNKENLFLFFPQGAIQSVYTKEFTFEKGLLSYILKNMKNDFQLVFNINLIDYGPHRRPELSVYYKTQTIDANTTADDLENEFNRFAKACFSKQKVE